MAKEKIELVDKLSINAADRSPLLRAQKETYLKTKEQGDRLNGIAQYMFWGATSLMVGIATAVIGGVGAKITIGSLLLTLNTPVVLGVAAVAAIGLAIGNIHFSAKGRAYSEKAEVLYSDIDSQQQAHRMVQAFAKAQVMGKINEADTPFAGTPGTSWAARVGGERNSKPASWAEKVTAEALAEEAAVLNNAAAR